jgi:predicted ArsR family transcriptional regulator
MSDSLNQILAEAGPHTAESLAARLPHFPVDAIRQALEALTAQGVLEREVGEEGGVPTYRYVAPERYVQHTWDVIKDPAKKPGVNPR